MGTKRNACDTSSMRAKACAWRGLSCSQPCQARVSSTDTSAPCRRTNHSAAATWAGSRSMSTGVGVLGLVIALEVHLFAAMEQCSYHVFAHHAVGDTELAGDGGGVQSVNLAHHER